MGLSFHDENSLVELTSAGNLRFAADDSNAIPETGTVNSERERNNDVEIPLGDESDIQMINR